MFKKIFKFMSGYVIIKVTGKNKERFLNICLAGGLHIWGVCPSDDGLLMFIGVRDFFRLRKPARTACVKVRIIRKCGIAVFLKKHKCRYGFLTAGVLVCVYFILVPQYIWCVEIVGAENADREHIEKILRDNGVFVGAKKSDIADLGDLKNAVIFGEPDVDWAWLYIDGAKARLELQEGIRPPKLIDKGTPTDIIASSDGIITKADVRRGERHINVGDTVTEGQLLVSGRVAVYNEGYDEKYLYVHSDADIKADTIRTAEGEFSNKEVVKTKTGNEKTHIALQVFGKEFHIGKKAETLYDECETAEKHYDVSLPFVGYIGLGASVKTVSEIHRDEHMLSEEEVIARATESLYEDIAKKLSVGAVITDERLAYRKNGQSYTVRLTVNLRESIGLEMPCKE